MSLGSQSAVVDGQRFALPTSAQWNPMRYGPQTTGVPQVSPTMPPFLGASNGQGASMGVSENVGGYGTAGNNALVTAIASEHPHNWRVSPVWWAVSALIIGTLLLRGVHWRKTVLEGEEGARVGRASEEARAEA